MLCCAVRCRAECFVSCVPAALTPLTLSAQLHSESEQLQPQLSGSCVSSGGGCGGCGERESCVTTRLKRAVSRIVRVPVVCAGGQQPQRRAPLETPFPIGSLPIAYPDSQPQPLLQHQPLLQQQQQHRQSPGVGVGIAAGAEVGAGRHSLNDSNADVAVDPAASTRYRLSVSSFAAAGYSTSISAPCRWPETSASRAPPSLASAAASAAGHLYFKHFGCGPRRRSRATPTGASTAIAFCCSGRGSGASALGDANAHVNGTGYDARRLPSPASQRDELKMKLKPKPPPGTGTGTRRPALPVAGPIAPPPPLQTRSNTNTLSVAGVGGSFLSAAVVGLVRSPSTGGSRSGSRSGFAIGFGSGSASPAMALLSREQQQHQYQSQCLRLTPSAHPTNPYTHYQKRFEQLRRETVWLEQTLLAMHRDD